MAFHCSRMVFPIDVSMVSASAAADQCVASPWANNTTAGTREPRKQAAGQQALSAILPVMRD